MAGSWVIKLLIQSITIRKCNNAWLLRGLLFFRERRKMGSDEKGVGKKLELLIMPVPLET